MRQQHHQSEEVDISRAEILLLIISILFTVSVIIYFISNWNYIPDNILEFSEKHKRWEERPKLSYLATILFCSFPFLVYTIFATKNKRVVDNTFFKRRKVSSDLLKAKKQFLIERRCFLCGFAIYQAGSFVSPIVQIEKQLGNLSMPSNINISLFFCVVIVINWFFHHMLWSQLADK